MSKRLFLNLCLWFSWSRSILLILFFFSLQVLYVWVCWPALMVAVTTPHLWEDPTTSSWQRSRWVQEFQKGVDGDTYIFFCTFFNSLKYALSTSLQSPWPQGTECVARYNFKGTSEQDLPFNKGDILTIIVVTKVNICSHDDRKF